MANILGTSFAQSGFSFDPNLSPANIDFAAAVRAVMAAAGYPTPESLLNTGTGTYNPAVGNPSVSVALTATNGVSTLAMRADASPALSQAITPTWTGTHTFSGGNMSVYGTTTLGAGTLAQGVLNVYANDTGGAIVKVKSSGTAGGGAAAGIYLVSASNTFNTNDFEIYQLKGTALVQNWGTGPLQISGGPNATGAVQGFGPTANAYVDMTPDTSTFTGTLTGFAAAQAGTAVACKWVRMGNIVTLVLNYNNASNNGTSNSTSFTLTGVPAAIQPTNAQEAKVPFLEDNGSAIDGSMLLSGGTVTFFKGASQAVASWTASGVKGLNNAASLTYILN